MQSFSGLIIDIIVFINVSRSSVFFDLLNKTNISSVRSEYFLLISLKQLKVFIRFS